MSAPDDLPLVVLASGSPRRRELLERYPIRLEIRPADLDESVLEGEEPEPYVRRLAREKAEAVRSPGDVVVAADTCVVLDGKILGKPIDVADALRMLAGLADRTHRVITAVAVAADDGTRVETVRTDVTMTPIPAADLAWYVATDEPHDKAGAYAIQGAGGRFVRRIEGSHSNVIGLPLDTVSHLLDRAGVPLTGPTDESRPPDVA
jgi:septum formation protein